MRWHDGPLEFPAMTPRRIGATVLLALQLAGLFVVVGPIRAASAATPPSEWVIGPRKKAVLLTFDGQTSSKNVGRVLDVLHNKNVTASFFISGEWLERNKEVGERIHDSGHVLGNRGYGNRPFTGMSDEEIVSSLDRAKKVLNKLGAGPRPFFRAPGGNRDLRVLQAAGSLGYRSVRWTHNPNKGVAKSVAKSVVGKARKGSIVSLDLWRRSHRNALPIIIRKLRKEHFGFRGAGVLKGVHAIRWDTTLRQGSSGPDVMFLQRMLRENTYAITAPDGQFGYGTLQAVFAFEKSFRLARDGVVTPGEFTRMVVEGAPWTRSRGIKRRYVDVDISRQVLMEVVKGRVIKTLPISSGNEQQYETDEGTATAHTPRGDFVIERKIPGWRTSDLGRLWYPSYFVGGFAIHGSESVPTYPASHGCVRIPMYATKGFYYRNPIGTPTFVHD